jgi:trehalose-6-phosphatase
VNNQINLQTILAQRPLGLVFDIDVTLSPIAPTPEEARLYPGVVSLLERAREHAHIAIVTGRAIDNEVDGMVELLYEIVEMLAFTSGSSPLVPG